MVGTLGAFGFMTALAVVGYGCSDKESDGATANDPDTGVIARVDSGTPDDPVDSSVADSAAAQVFKAYATITSTTLAGAIAAGQATFTEQNGEVTVVVDMSAADPVGTMHGIHIHQNGSCADNDSGAGGAIVNAGAAGAHWNPTDAGHGYPAAAVHHLGDMGNISIGADGKGTLTLLSKEWTVQPGPKSVVGHALVFHIRQDDGTSQPVGDAGTRPGCGVIGTTAPPPPTPCLDNTLVGAAPGLSGRRRVHDAVRDDQRELQEGRRRRCREEPHGAHLHREHRQHDDQHLGRQGLLGRDLEGLLRRARRGRLQRGPVPVLPGSVPRAHERTHRHRHGALRRRSVARRSATASSTMRFATARPVRTS